MTRVILPLKPTDQALVTEVAGKVLPFEEEIASAWANSYRQYLEGPDDNQSSVEPFQKMVRLLLTSLTDGDFEAYFRRIKDKGVELAASKASYEQLILSVHLYEDAAAPRLKELFGPRFPVVISVLDQLYHNVIAIIARAYFTQLENERETSHQLAERVQKISEQRLRQFVEQSPFALCMLDKRMRYLFASPRWLSDFHLNADDIQGKNHYDIFPEVPRQWRIIHQRCLAGAIEKSDEDAFERADGTIARIRWEIRPWYDNDGRIGGILIFSEDISQRKEAEDHLKAALDSRDEFLSIASHELKTPLSALSLKLQILIREIGKNPEGVTGAQLLSKIERCLADTKRINKLVEELLDLTRIRAGKLELSRQPVDLRNTVAEIIEQMTPHALRVGSALSVHSEGPVTGNWDPDRVAQIVANLVSNALKYGQGKPIEISLAVEPQAKVARLQVKDQGMGIPPEMHSRIFERFERAAEAQGITGLGLGLYIVQQIVKAHGGSIRVESSVGRGSLFAVELPLSLTVPFSV